MFQTYLTKVKQITGLLSQPDPYTCQSACVGMATNETNIYGIRQRLESLGDPGSPQNMGVILRERLGDRYSFDDNACLSECRDWLKAGEFLITHGWFTGSGHVVAMDGVEVDPQTLSYKLNMRDPWSEFDAKSWAYPYPSDRFDGYYSSYIIYAACVVGQSVWDAAAAYRRGELDSMRKGAWVHRIRPA
jgi:hypothetical protein